MAKKLTKERGAFVLIGILLVLLVGWWSISSFASVTSSFSTAAYNPDTPPVVDSRYTPVTPVIIHHRVANGTHTYKGSLNLPADCDMLSTSVEATTGNPRHLKVFLMVLHSSGGCISTSSVVATAFSVSFRGMDNAPVVFDGLTVNNVKIPSSVVEGT
ncbi:MAG: hypothetical protein Q7S26_00195 [bacterium]|nr:hypothetical protein [bacterium]